MMFVNHLNGIPPPPPPAMAHSKSPMSPFRSMMRTEESSRAMSWVSIGAMPMEVFLEPVSPRMWAWAWSRSQVEEHGVIPVIAPAHVNVLPL